MAVPPDEPNAPGGQDVGNASGRITIDTSQAESAGKRMGAVGASMERAMQGVDAATRKVEAELKVFARQAQEAVVQQRGTQQRLSAAAAADAQVRVQLARAEANVVSEAARRATHVATEQAKQVTQAANNSAKAQVAAANNVTKTQVAASNNATKTQVANANLVAKIQVAASNQATKIQIANINQVTQMQAAQARAALANQQFQQRQALQQQAFQNRQAAQGAGGGGGGLGGALRGALGGLRGGLGGVLVGGALGGLGGLAVNQVMQAGQALIEQAAAADAVTRAYARQSVAARQLAGSQAQLNALLQAYDEATGEAVDRATALADVTRLQAIGFADSVEEMDRFVRAARGISVAMGKGMNEITEEVALAIANQSSRRLDQIGLGVEEVNQRIKELRAENAGWTREMAYQEAILSLAEEKYGALTQAAEAQATGVERLNAAWTDLGLSISQVLSGPINRVAGALAGAVDDAQKEIDEFNRNNAVRAQGPVPGGVEGVSDIRSAEFMRGHFQSQLQGLLQSIATRSDLRTEDVQQELDYLTEHLRKANITVAGLNARAALAGGGLPGQRFPGPGSYPEAVSTEFSDEQKAVISAGETERSRMELGFLQERNAASAEYEAQRSETIRDYEAQIARDTEDFARQRARAEEDHALAIADVQDLARRREVEAARDLARQLERMVRDSNRRLADLQEEHNEDLAEMEQEHSESVADLAEDLAEDEAKAQQDSAKRILEFEEDFAKERVRAQGQYQESLLEAAGNLDAKAVRELQRRYAREEAEAQDAHAERVSDEKENLQETLDELNLAHQKRLADEEEALAKSREQANQAYAEQVADEKAALQQRIDDANAAHGQQLADAKAADAQRLSDMETDFATRRQREDTDFNLRMGRLAQDHNDQLTEMDRQHGLRLTQIATQQGAERLAFEQHYQQQLTDAGIFRAEWMVEQNQRQKDALKLFDEWWNKLDERLEFGPPADGDADENFPTANAYLEWLKGELADAQAALDRAQTPEEISFWNTVITDLNALIAKLEPATVAAAGTYTVPHVDSNGVVTPAGGVNVAGNQPLTLHVDAGAIVVYGAVGQSETALAEEFRTQLLTVIHDLNGAGGRYA